MNRCSCCHRLALRSCRRSPWCRAWAAVHERFLALTFVSTEPLEYSRAAGKFVVSLFGGAA